MLSPLLLWGSTTLVLGNLESLFVLLIDRELFYADFDELMGGRKPYFYLLGIDDTSSRSSSLTLLLLKSRKSLRLNSSKSSA
jgi:hypothetical protein